MRPDHTVVDYASSGETFSVTPLQSGDGDPESQRGMLTRMTFCFAWLFGLEAFLAANAAESRTVPGKRH
ncbi:hypothetical protein P3T43_003727 [Paraburkholderia sp. GAS41]|jgi:hypothetical protein|uniref:hypothetical protein n=1 Tax=Paraburkholderia sp. GAS41 TaxID=3035134 RepID=UPI003D1B681D